MLQFTGVLHDVEQLVPFWDGGRVIAARRKPRRLEICGCAMDEISKTSAASVCEPPGPSSSLGRRKSDITPARPLRRKVCGRTQIVENTPRKLNSSHR